MVRGPYCIQRFYENQIIHYIRCITKKRVTHLRAPNFVPLRQRATQRFLFFLKKNRLAILLDLKTTLPSQLSVAKLVFAVILQFLHFFCYLLSVFSATNK